MKGEVALSRRRDRMADTSADQHGADLATGPKGGRVTSSDEVLLEVNSGSKAGAGMSILRRRTCRLWRATPRPLAVLELEMHPGVGGPGLPTG